MFRALTVAAVVATAAASMPAAAAEFSGFRAELQGGWDNPQITYDAYANNGAYIGEYHESKSGFMYGAELGYDFPVSETVILGVLGSIGGTTVSLDPQAFGTTILGYDVNANVGFNWNLAARAGFKVGENTLLYGTAGYASTNIKYYVTEYSGLAVVEYENSRTYGGFLFAAGIEQAFGEQFYGKAEYRYSNYSSGVSRNDIVFGAGMRF